MGIQLGTPQVCYGRGRCTYATGTCVCDRGYSGDGCNTCASGYIRFSDAGPCVYMRGSATTCTDGVKNGQEEGVDCGGPDCPQCVIIRGFKKWSGPQVLFLLLYIVLPIVCTILVCIGVVWAYRRCRSSHNRSLSQVYPASAAGGPRRKSAMVLTSKKVRVMPIQGDWSESGDSTAQFKRDAQAAGLVTIAENLVVDWAGHEKSKKR